ncbi:MAG TPA: preprotein translocase subunit SecG [Verrucomicrobiae bacterium]
MNFIAGVLTLFLVANSLLLILLVLVQLPKKDAGAGLAFGSGAADALFGAGSGNVLTKITKWGMGIFMAIAVLLGYLQDNAIHGSGSSNFIKEVQQKQQQMPPPTAPSASQPAARTTPPPANDVNLPTTIPAAAASTASATNPAK